MYKLDLHTHSTASADGSIRPEQYAEVLENDILDYVAITDHNHIELAREMHARLGERIIIGEEISTTEGDIIGLFLSDLITPGQSAMATVHAIKDQGGLVYIPHPFETVRKGISSSTLNTIIDQVDIIEVYNGRALFQNRGPEATTFARLHKLAIAASSDAHGAKGLGTTFTAIADKPSAAKLVSQLGTAHLTTQRPPLKTLLYPKANRIRKRLSR